MYGGSQMVLGGSLRIKVSGVRVGKDLLRKFQTFEGRRTGTDTESVECSACCHASRRDSNPTFQRAGVG